MSQSYYSSILILESADESETELGLNPIIVRFLFQITGVVVATNKVSILL